MRPVSPIDADRSFSEEEEEGEEEGWEDVSDEDDASMDNDGEEEDDDNDLYDTNEREINTCGIVITPLVK
jgi:hypothetical protein